MKKFYLEYKDEEILPPAVAKLPWTHNIILIEKIKDKNIRFWYANEAANGNWSKVVLDDQIKDVQDEPSIGLLLCKSKEKLTVEYSLKGVDKPIGVSSYEVEKYIPKDILEKLPTEEEINLHLDIEEGDINE